MKAKPARKPAAKAARPAKAASKKAAPKPAAKKAVTPPKAAAAKPAPKPAVKAVAKAVAKAPAPKVVPVKSVAAKPLPKPKPASIAARRKEMAHFRSLLLDRQRELMRAYKTSKGDSQSHLDNGTEDYIDYAVNSYAKEFLLSLTEMDRKQLLLVEEALRRIDRGEYGRCQQCGEEINRKRLDVAPWARHCVRCQELEEQGLLPQAGYAAVPGGLDEDGMVAGDEVLEEEPEVEEEEEAADEEEDEADEPPPVVADDSEE